MSLPFTVEQFLGVFASYNEAVWPVQVVLNAMAVTAIGLAVWTRPGSDRAIAAILAVLWLWTGVVYHILFFTTITGAAYLFGAVSIAQAIVFVAFGVVAPGISFRARRTARGLAGAALVVYALVAYPVLGSLLGHGYPGTPTFGLPCPTTIFTFGMLVWTDRPVPVAVLVLPICWAVVGSSAAASLTMTEDAGLAVAAVVAALLTLDRRRRLAQTARRSQPSGSGPRLA